MYKWATYEIRQGAQHVDFCFHQGTRYLVQYTLVHYATIAVLTSLRLLKYAVRYSTLYAASCIYVKI